MTMTEKLVKGKQRKSQKIQHAYSRAEDMDCSKILNSLLSNEDQAGFLQELFHQRTAISRTLY